MSKEAKYGSISGGGGGVDPEFQKVEGAEDRGPSDYEMGQTYYLKSSKGGWKKFLRGALPILVALFIVGGVGYYFFENILNPGGRSGGGEIETTDETVKTTTSIPVHLSSSEAKSTDKAAEVPETKSSSSSTSASCKSHPKCVATGLTGMCCPAAGGIMLDCCN